MHKSNSHGTSPYRGGLAWLALGAVLTAAVLVAMTEGDASAGDDLPVTQFLSVTGEGPTAKAWFEGAQPSGVKIQQALDKFNKQGYRVKVVTEPHPSAGSGYVWNIIMER